MNKIIKIKPDLIASEPTLRGMLTEKHYQMFEKLLSKSQIKIEKSARLLGVNDILFRSLTSMVSWGSIKFTVKSSNLIQKIQKNSHSQEEPCLPKTHACIKLISELSIASANRRQKEDLDKS